MPDWFKVVRYQSIKNKRNKKHKQLSIHHTPFHII